MEARAPLPYLRALRDGLLLYKENRWAEAIAAFDRAHDAAPFELKPGYYKAKALTNLQLAEAKKNAKKNDEEINMAVTRASAGSQDNGPGYPEYLRGMADYTEGKIPQAKELFMQAERAGCQRADLFLHMGMIEANQGNEALARNYFERAQSLNNPDTESDIRLQLGVMTMVNFRHAYEESNAHFEAVLSSAHQNNLLAWLYQGKLNQSQGESVLVDSEKYYQRAAECYSKLLKQTQFETPLYLRLLLAIQVRRLLRKYKQSGIDTGRIMPGLLIDELKAKERKSVEEVCVLFLAQVEMGKFAAAWETFFQLLEMSSAGGGCLYDNIPYYLKQDFYVFMVTWPADRVQALVYTDKTDQLKRIVVDLLRVRETENYDIRLLQINAGLVALSPKSLLGSILYIKQGMLTSPHLGSGKLKELAQHLTNVMGRMSLTLNAPGEVFQLCERTKPVLLACKESLEAYPLIYRVIVGSEPPVRQTWVGTLFGSASSAAAAQPHQLSPQPQPGTIKQGP